MRACASRTVPLAIVMSWLTSSEGWTLLCTHPCRARAVAKQLLKAHRTSIALFHVYARLELHAGRVDEVRPAWTAPAPPHVRR